ncbi:MAG: hypothetical protein HY904_25945 [Deltaproteobacteria bacterium]|nr:hypothetical protein [Deltaproteobacteria bacterium]
MVRAQVSLQEQQLHAAVTLETGTGEVQGSRTLASGNRDCDELTASMALAISLAIDPLVLMRPSRKPRPRAPFSPSPSGGMTRHPRRTFLPGYSAYSLVGAGWGGTPSPTGTLSVGAAAHWRGLSVAGETTPEAPSTLLLSGGSILVTRLYGSLLACGHAFFLLACGKASAGVMMLRASSGLALGTGAVPVWTVGGRFGIRWRALRRLALVAVVDPELVLFRVRLQDPMSGAPLWRAPPVSLSARLGAELVFP